MIDVHGLILDENGNGMVGIPVFLYSYQDEAGQRCDTVGPDHPMGAGYFHRHFEKPGWFAANVHVRRPGRTEISTDSFEVPGPGASPTKFRISSSGSSFITVASLHLQSIFPLTAMALYRKPNENKIRFLVGDAVARLVGAGNYRALCDRRQRPEFFIDALADAGCNFFRTISSMPRVNKADFVSPWKNRSEWLDRRDRMLARGRARGVWTMVDLFDEVTRPDKAGYPRTENTWNGRGVTNETAAELTAYYLEGVDPAVKDAFLPCWCNEPPHDRGSWLGESPIDVQKTVCDVIRQHGYLVSPATGGDDQSTYDKAWYQLNNGFGTVQLVFQHAYINSQIERNRKIPPTDRLRQINAYVATGFSTDGAGRSDITQGIPALAADMKARGYSLEVNLMDPWDTNPVDPKLLADLRALGATV